MAKRANATTEKRPLSWGNEHESWGVDIVDVNNNMFSAYHLLSF